MRESCAPAPEQSAQALQEATPNPPEMTHHLSESLSPRTASPYRGHRSPVGVPRALRPVELAEWLESRLDGIARRWYQDLARRDALGDGPMPGLMEDFLRLLVAFLPGLVSAGREQVEPVWAEASELFGTLGARRGLERGSRAKVDEFVDHVSIERMGHASPKGHPLKQRPHAGIPMV